MEKEKELIAEHHGAVDERGAVRFKEVSAAEKYRDAVEELNNLEAEIEFVPISVSLDQMENVNMKPDDIGRLEGFVNFE